MKNKTFFMYIVFLGVVLLLAINYKSVLGGIQQASPPNSFGYVNVPAAAFVPIADGANYLNNGFELEVYSDSQFIAPVYLPHEATLYKLTMYYSDSNSLEDSSCILRAMDTTTFLYVTDVSGEVNSDGTGQGSDSTSSFNPSIVDNSRYFYILNCTLYNDGVFSTNLYGVRIDYTYPVYLPMTRN